MLPTDMTYGYVVGRYLLAVADSDDADNLPDAKPASGTVKFTPLAPVLLSEIAPPATVLPQPVTCSLDGSGALVDPNAQPGVWLVAGQYDVSFAFVGVTLATFRIEVTAAATADAPLDLTLVSPLTPSPATVFVVNEAVYTQTLAARDEAVAAATDAITTVGQAFVDASLDVDGALVLVHHDGTTTTISGIGGGGTGAVSSVNGKTGDVTLSAADVGAADATATTAALAGKEAKITAGTTAQYWRGDKTWQALPTAPVSSVNGKTGAVSLAATDVGAADAAATTTALAGKEPTIPAGQAGQYYDGTKTWKPFPAGGAVTADSITDATATGKAVIRAADAAAARAAIGAGTSNLAIGTTATTAKAGNYQPTAANISDATATGRAVLTAASTAAARTAIGAGTSNVAIGTTAGTAADASAVATSLAGKEPTIAAGTTAQYWRGDKTWQTLPLGGGAPTLDNLPAGTLHVQRWDGTGTQPTRDTARTDIPVEWRQPAAPPSGGSYAVVGVDTWVVTP